MTLDPNHDTVPTPAVRDARRSPMGRFIRSMPGAFLILFFVLTAVLTFAGIGGYYVGIADRDRAAATDQAIELARQYQLGLEDMQAGRYALAIQRFEFILSLDPGYPGAADHLADAYAAAPQVTLSPFTTPGLSASTPTLPSTAGPETAPTLFSEAQTAFAAGDWNLTLQKIGALRVIDPTYESLAVRNMLFQSLRNRGIAYINAGKLELGLADLDQAARIGTLDEEARQYEQWATIYIAGVSYWGLNWPRTIETFQLLYTIAPYFRDTITRLRDAHLGYARQLEAGGDPCSAAKEYAAALELDFDQLTEDRRAAADIACQFGTPTPDGTLTPFPTPEGTLTPPVTLDGTPSETSAGTGAGTETPAPTLAETETLTASATETRTPTLTETPTGTP